MSVSSPPPSPPPPAASSYSVLIYTGRSHRATIQTKGAVRIKQKRRVQINTAEQFISYFQKKEKGKREQTFLFEKEQGIGVGKVGGRS